MRRSSVGRERAGTAAGGVSSRRRSGFSNRKAEADPVAQQSSAGGDSEEGAGPQAPVSSFKGNTTSAWFSSAHGNLRSVAVTGCLTAPPVRRGSRPTSLAVAASAQIVPPATQVPVDICVRPETRAVIITGPNTGGKTAALKVRCSIRVQGVGFRIVGSTVPGALTMGSAFPISAVPHRRASPPGAGPRVRQLCGSWVCCHQISGTQDGIEVGRREAGRGKQQMETAR